MKRSSITLGCSFLLTMIFCLSNQGKADFSFFQSSKKVEAESHKEYMLKDSDGYWFILTRKFSGTDAQSQANKLVLELRKKYKLQAFIYKYDPDQNDLDEMAEKSGYLRRYRYQTPRIPEVAVLVGSFPTVDDLALKKALLTVKRCKPECLKNDSDSKSIIAEFEKLSKKDKEFRNFGPLGGAIVVRNPLISKDFYCQKGVVDPFVEKINSDSKFSLLNNPKMYTLRVATFSGDTTYESNGKAKRSLESQLKEAGIKAAALCEALRKRGVEAWEFHDRDSSFVTIGSFDNYGSIRPDGRTEMNPDINKLIDAFRGEVITDAAGTGSYRAFTVSVEIKDPNSTAFGGMGKRVKMDIPFDLQPVIIMVPQRPENAKRTLQAQQKLKTELEQYEMKRIEENEEYDRNYSKYALRGTKPIPIDSPELMKNEGFMKEFSQIVGTNNSFQTNNGLPSNFGMIQNQRIPENQFNNSQAFQTMPGNIQQNNINRLNNVGNQSLMNQQPFNPQQNGYSAQNAYPSQNNNQAQNNSLIRNGQIPSNGQRMNQNQVANQYNHNIQTNNSQSPNSMQPVQTANQKAAPVY